MEARGAQVDKARFPSTTPRWLKLERFFVALSGLSLCGLICAGYREDFLSRNQNVLILALAGVAYGTMLLHLVRLHGHKLFHWVVGALSFTIALIPTPLWAIALFFGRSDRLFLGAIILLHGLGIPALPVILSHACLSAAAREGYHQQGGGRLGILWALVIPIAITVAAACFFFAWNG